MALLLYPYSQYNAGRMSDVEHETLWSGFPDGFDLDYQASGVTTPLLAAVNNSTRVWTVQPGRMAIMGHVLEVTTTAATGTLAAGAASVRNDTVVAYVNHSTSPWTYGIAIKQGTAGGGLPALSKVRTGLYEVAIANFQVSTGAGAVLSNDWRHAAFPAPVDLSGGTPVADATIGTTPTVVNTINLAAEAYDRRLVVSAGCYLNPTLTTDVFDIQLWYNGAMPARGYHCRKEMKGIDTIYLSGPSLSLPAFATGTLVTRVSRFSGGGLVGSSSDANLNYISVTALHAGT